MNLGDFLYILYGALTTLKYGLSAVFFGLFIGSMIAIFRMSRKKILNIFSAIYVSIFRGTPLLLQISVIFYGIPAITEYKFSAFGAGVLAFSLNSGAYISEIIRSGIKSVPSGQFEAGRALGMKYSKIMRFIIFPQAIRNIFPALGNELVTLIKESAIVSIIGEADLMYRANMVAGSTYDYFTPILSAGLCYYILVVFITSIIKFLEHKMASKW